MQPQAVAEPGQRVGARLERELAVEPLELAVEARDLLVQVGDAPRRDEPGAQVERGDRLRQVVVGARLHALEDVLVLPERRRQHHVGVPVVAALADPPAELGAVEAGHHPVGDQHVGCRGLELPPCLLAVGPRRCTRARAARRSPAGRAGRSTSSSAMSTQVARTSSLTATAPWSSRAPETRSSSWSIAAEQGRRVAERPAAAEELELRAQLGETGRADGRRLAPLRLCAARSTTRDRPRRRLRAGTRPGGGRRSGTRSPAAGATRRSRRRARA